VRALCESGAVEAESTPGGQWRIPADELEKLKRDGLPLLARPLPQARNGRPHQGRPALLGAPSERVVSAAEEVAIKESRLRERRLDRELEETEEFFRERQDMEAQRQAEEWEIEQERRANAEAQRLREERDNRLLQYAMNSVPSEARGEVEQEIHEHVQAALDKVRLGEPPTVAQRVVDATVAKALRPWRRSKDIARAIEDARRNLPFEMRGFGWEPTGWESQACQSAAKALEAVRPDASYGEMRAIAREATKSFIVAFEEHKAAVANADAAQRAKQEAAERTRRDRDNRERLLRYPRLQFPYGMPDAEQQTAITASRRAFAALPEGSPERDLEAARDRAIKPYLDAQTRRKRKEQLIATSMDQIPAYVRRLAEEWDFEGKTAWTLDQEIREPIRKALEEILTGDEDAGAVGITLRRLVRRQLELA
jgi:hypothetical protein